MNRQDYEVLADLCEQVAKLSRQRTGRKTGRGVISSSVMKRIATFTRKCKGGELKGRDRRLKSDRLMLEIIRSMGGV